MAEPKWSKTALPSRTNASAAVNAPKHAPSSALPPGRHTSLTRSTASSVGGAWSFVRSVPLTGCIRDRHGRVDSRDSGALRRAQRLVPGPPVGPLPPVGTSHPVTTRSLSHDGKWMCKQRRNYLLDKDGNRLRDPVTRQYKLGKSIKTNNWDEPERIEEWRKGWADICRSWFRQCGISKEITHISYARQGLDREPTIHLGAKVKALEDRGISTDRSKKNHDITVHNHNLDRSILRQRIERNYVHELELSR